MKKHKHVGQASHIQDGVRWLFSVLIITQRNEIILFSLRKYFVVMNIYFHSSQLNLCHRKFAVCPVKSPTLAYREGKSDVFKINDDNY